MSHIFIVDDDPSIIESIGSVLRAEGYTVTGFTDPEEFLRTADATPPAVAIVDIFFSESAPTGDELVARARERFPLTQCLVISGESDIGRTLACLKNGALDFIEKPVSLPRLITAVRNAERIYNIRVAARERYRILGRGTAIRSVIDRITRLAPLNECVLIYGENGTGKELVAHNLHLQSQRYALPLYPVNCSSLNPNLIESELFGHKAGSFTGAERDKKGFFQAASGSSLFIDEIGDFDAALQSKILRVLQEKQVIPVGATAPLAIDVRMIFATHRRLDELIRSERFREDLYYRISTFTITVPPLRDRLGDIDDLAPFFLARFLIDNNLPPKEFTADALHKLKRHHYPGNIRELAKIVKNAAIFCAGEHIGPDAIDFEARPDRCDLLHRTRAMTLAESKDLFERELVLHRLHAFKNDVPKTAESLGIIKNNFYRKLKDLGLSLRSGTED